MVSHGKWWNCVVGPFLIMHIVFQWSGQCKKHCGSDEVIKTDMHYCIDSKLIKHLFSHDIFQSFLWSPKIELALYQWTCITIFWRQIDWYRPEILWLVFHTGWVLASILLSAVLCFLILHGKHSWMSSTSSITPDKEVSCLDPCASGHFKKIFQQVNIREV